MHSASEKLAIIRLVEDFEAFKALVLVLIFFGARLLAKLAQHIVRHSMQRSSIKTSYLLKEFLI